jgi:hypothetical protein
VSVFVIEVYNSQPLFTTNIYIKLKIYIVLHLQYNKIFTIYTGLVQSRLCTADYALLTSNLVYHGSRTHDRRPPQPVGPGPCINITQYQGDPVIPPTTGFPFSRLLLLARPRWR